MGKRTVIQVWTHKVANVQTDTYNNFWGFGDIIRGTIRLYELSLKYDFDLIVDIQHHPVSAYLKPQVHRYSEFIRNKKDSIIFTPDAELYINGTPGDLLYFLTNDGYGKIKEPLSTECKVFMKDLLTPNDEFKTYIDNKKSTIPNGLEYNILHYRLGDEMLVRKNGYQIPQMDKNNIEENDILMSDNILFKQQMKNDIFMFDIQPTHLGYDSDTEAVRDSLFEFIVITQAKKIKTYSVHTHISGFVLWAHHIYDIPFKTIGF